MIDLVIHQTMRFVCVEWCCCLDKAQFIKSNQIKSSLFRHHIFRKRFRGVYSARSEDYLPARGRANDILIGLIATSMARRFHIYSLN